MRNRISSLGTIQLFVMFVFFGMKLVPQFQYSFAGTFWSLAYQGIFSIWLITSILRSGIWFGYLSKYLKNWMVWIVYLTLAFLLFPNTQMGFFSLNLTFWEPMFIYFYYTEVLKDGEKEATIIAVFCMICLLFGLLQSIQSVNVNELAAREASSGHLSSDAILTGNYSFTATLTIILPVCYMALVSKIKIWWKMLVVIVITSTFYFIIHCNLMISILCLFFTLPVYFIFGKDARINIKRLLVILAILIFLTVTVMIWKQLIIFLLLSFAEFIDSKEINNKVIQLISLLNGSLVGNVASRFGLVEIAWNTFIHHPFVGIGPQNNASIYFKTYLGMHATFFDDIARYGILGMGIMLSVYIAFYQNRAKLCAKTKCMKVLKTCMIIYIIISMLNPTISANVGIALFFIIPSLSDALLRTDRIERN